MKKNILILVLVMIGIVVLIISGCNSGGSGGGTVNGGSGGGSVIGKVSNTFGNPLSRDIDGDGDNYTGVILNNIAGGGSWDWGNSLAIDGSGKVYVTGGSYNSTNDDAYVIKIE